MIFSLNNIKWFKHIIVLLIFTHLIGCTPWKVLKEPVKDQLIQKEPTEVKLKLKSGDSFELKNPNVHEDSLTGIKWKSDTLTFAFNDIEETSVRELHIGRTVLLVTVLVAVPAFIIIYGATHPSFDLKWGQ